MSVSKTKNINLEKQLLSLQAEVAELRKKNTDLEERLNTYSLVNIGQISLINKLVDKVPFGVMLLDEQHQIIHINAAGEKIFSSYASEMKGKSRNDYFKCFDETLKTSPLSDSKGEINLQKISCVNNDKYIMHSAIESNEGSENIVIETFIDVTEIKQAEQELINISKTKDEFLGMISHELRTPLSVIQGYSSLLEEALQQTKSSDASMYIEKIIQSGEKLLDIVNNLLELSDLIAGKINIDIIPIDLDLIVTQLKYRLERDFSINRNTLIFDCEDVEVFEQDLVLLMKILYELLLNANKFSKDGEVTLSVFVKKELVSERLYFKVTDTGCGMTEDTMRHVFSAFHQADSSLTRSYEGLGLGLSLVKKRITIINGQIEIESELGNGSSFTVSFPFHPVND